MWAALLVVGGLLVGQAEAEVPLELTVRRLVRQLEAAELTQRDQAEAQLVELGAAVLDVLPQTSARAPAETQQRLARIRQKLQRTLAESAAAPSSVTLQADDRPVFEILAAIEKQTGNSIRDARQELGQAVGEDARVSVDFQATPFWQAVDDTLDKAELTVYPYGEERVVSVTNRPPTRLPRQSRATYGGPFRFEPITVVAQQDLRDFGNSGLQLTVEVSWEPRVNPISLRLPLDKVQVTDGTGQPLELDAPAGQLEVPVNPGATTVEIMLPLKLPPPEIKRIGKVRGTLQTMIPGKVQEFRFDDITKARNVAKRIGAVTVTLEGVRRNGDIWEARVRTRFEDAGAAMESHRDWISQNQAYLLAPGGKEPIASDAMEMTMQTENELGVAYLFYLEQPPAGYHLIYKTPGAVISTSFDFTLEDIELP